MRRHFRPVHACLLLFLTVISKTRKWNDTHKPRNTSRKNLIQRVVEFQTDFSGFLHLLNALGDEVILLDSTGHIVASNDAWERFRLENSGDAATCSVGSNYIEVCHSAAGSSSAEARIIPNGFEKTLQSGEPFRCEYPCDSPTEKRWFELTANRFEHDGNVYLIVQHRNITKRHIEREDVEKAFITSNAMAALVATTADAILSYDLDGNIITWNQSAEKLYGYSKEEVLGKSLELLYPENWPKQVTYYRDEIIAGRLRDFEAIRIAKDGTEREVWITCAAIRSMDGEVVAISNIHRDVTEMRKAERARDLIANEVIHRAKNMLSVVTAIQRQTARGAETLDGFIQSFDARLESLSKSTDLLVKNAWTSVSLGDLVSGHLQPFTSGGDNCHVKMVGPQINLRPESVQTIGMAIHELATNSAKYGVLMQGQGQVAISWATGGEDKALDLVWLETGFVADAKPKKKGFGSTVLTMYAKTMLDAETTYTVDPNKIEWKIRVPPAHFHID